MGLKKSQKNFKIFLPVKKIIYTFAPASRNTLTSVNEERNKIRHVPRHIELTAVLKEISRQIIRVIES